VNGENVGTGTFDAAAQLEALPREELIRIIPGRRQELARPRRALVPGRGEGPRHGPRPSRPTGPPGRSSTVVEARRIMERLGMAPGGGIPALVEALKHRLYSRLNVQEVTELSDARAVFVMRDCRVQSARKRKGLPDFPCKSVASWSTRSSPAPSIRGSGPAASPALPIPTAATSGAPGSSRSMSPDPKLADPIARATADSLRGAFHVEGVPLLRSRSRRGRAARGRGRGGPGLRPGRRRGPRGGADRPARIRHRRGRNERMLAAATELLAGRSNARVVKSDLSAVDLPSGCADVVVSNCAINHAPDKAAVYREVHRLLRPGGRFAVSDVVSEEPLPESVRNDPAPGGLLRRVDPRDRLPGRHR